MATQKLWNYNDFVSNWNRSLGGPGADAVRGALGQTGDGTIFGRSMSDAMRQSLAQQFGPQAMQWSDAQVQQAAQQHGILGGKEQSFGEIAMEGLTGPLAIPAAFLTAGALTGAFEGVGAASAGGSAAGAGGASAAGGGYLMPAAVPESAATLAEWGLVETAPGVWSNVGNAATFGGLSATAPSGEVASAGASSGGGGGAAAGGGATVPATTSIFDKVVSSPAILGAGAGALLGGLGGSQEAGTITVEEGLPDWLKAYAKPVLDQYGAQIQNYQIDPYGIMAGAGQQYRDTINGMYLDPSTNKYLQEYFNAGAERIKGTLSPSFGHMQAFGSHTGYNEALAGGLTDLATGIYGPAYEAERNRQAQLTAAAPNFLQSQSQAAFSPYQGYLSTIAGLGKQKEQPYFQPNAMQGILGGAMAGYGLGKIFS